MSLAKDANYNTTMLRVEDPVGGYLEESFAVSTWKRLMPADNTATLVSDQDRQLNIGALRSDILDVEGWDVIFLGDGYYDRKTIEKYENNILTFTQPLAHFEGLTVLGSSVSYVMFPTLDIPLGITPDAELEIAIGKEDLWTPPTIKKFANLEADQLLIMHTRQIQKIFYKSAAAVNITWGEHYVV